MSTQATFSENIQNDSDLYTHLVRADQILREVIGPKRKDRVEADWAFIDDGRFQKVVLRLKDDAGEVEGSFTESELNDDRMYRRLTRLWSKLLQIGSISLTRNSKDVRKQEIKEFLKTGR